jgi:NADPH2:quinone reductase
VAALHQLGAPYGSYAEYAIAWDHTVFHIGERPFEEAAAIPMAYYMASIGLFGMLRLPMMWQRANAATVVKTASEDDSDKQADARNNEIPLVIYGASGAVGSAAVQLAQLADIHPLICVAGESGASVVQPLLNSSKGDVLVDYREGSEKLVQKMQAALGERKLHHVFDCVSEHGSSANTCRVLERGGRISLVLPSGVKDVPPGFEINTTMAGSLWAGFDNRSETHGSMGFEGPMEFGYCYSRLIGHWFREGKLRVHTPEAVEGGLLGVEKALKKMRKGENHGVKYVVRVGETPGLNA